MKSGAFEQATNSLQEAYSIGRLLSENIVVSKSLLDMATLQLKQNRKNEAKHLIVQAIEAASNLRSKEILNECAPSVGQRDCKILPISALSG